MQIIENFRFKKTLSTLHEVTKESIKVVPGY